MTVEVSSPDKVLFPASKATKADLVGYYATVAEAMMPSLLGRPLTLHRFPRGIGAKGFMQKNAADHYPASIDRVEIPKAEGGVTDYPMVTQADDIPWLANQNAITFHIWTARQPTLDHPDWLILDFDPPENAADRVELVRSVALGAQSVLDRFQLVSYPVATGSKGFHLWIPLDGSVDHDTASAANRALAGLVVAEQPDTATTEFLKKDRGGRVFVDWLRSRRGATVVAPLSVRANVTASVAAPITWDELPSVAPDQWSMTRPGDVDDLLSRPVPQVARGGDGGQRLPVDAIVEAARSAGVDLDTPFDRFGRR